MVAPPFLEMALTTSPCFVAIEIGGTKLQLLVGDSSATILDEVRLTVDRSRGGAGIRAQIEEALPRLLARWQPSATGVGFGGPVDWQTGQVCCSHQIEGWSNFPLGEWLSQLTQRPVAVDNDANLAALGEATHGAGAGCDPVFYMTLGSGVGGGLVAGGAIYHGAKPGESEIGHLRLDRQGTVLESRCSGWAVDEKVRRLQETGAAVQLNWPSGSPPGGEARWLGPALQRNDPDARRILRETAEDLAFGLSHVVHLFHPETIVMGGGLSQIGEPLREALAGALRGFVMEAFGEGPSVRLAALGERAVPAGCLVAARRLPEGAGRKPH